MTSASSVPTSTSSASVPVMVAMVPISTRDQRIMEAWRPQGGGSARGLVSTKADG
jgi:hypothetical protein